jgi:cytochrome c biogenesis protein CcmG/thiol:disulfide interchange protein DsbE
MSARSRCAVMTTLRCCVALLVAAACAPRDATTGGPVRVQVGAPVPAYAAVSLAGDSVSLPMLRDKVVLLNVWATWCHPCRAEIPELQALHAKYADKGLDVVGVSIDGDGSEEAIREFMQEFGMTYRIWRDPAERVSAQFLVIGVPATFLIDRKGLLQWRMTGPIRPGDSTLTNAIERALASSE